MQDLTTDYPDSGRNPFEDDVFSADTPIPGEENVHRAAFYRCVQIVEELELNPRNTGSGRIVVISSPKAGFGKTHLLARIADQVADSANRIELRFLSRSVSWNRLLADAVLAQQTAVSPNFVSFSLFEEAAGHFLSTLIRCAVTQSIIEERECPVSMSSLETESAALFSESARSKFLNWLRKKSNLLARRTRMTSHGLSPDDTVFWTRLFISLFSKDSKDSPSLSGLDEEDAKSRFLQLLRIASDCRPLFVTVDHLDGSFGSENLGLEISTVLTSISENVPASLIILSVNRDVWNSVFPGKLPSAMLDRMTGDLISLAPCSPEEAIELVTQRLRDFEISERKSGEFAAMSSEKLNWNRDKKLYPRRVFRQVRELWTENKNEFSNAVEEILEAFGELPTEEKQRGEETNFTPDSTFAASRLAETQNIFEGQKLVYPDRPHLQPEFQSPITEHSSEPPRADRIKKRLPLDINPPIQIPDPDQPAASTFSTDDGGEEKKKGKNGHSHSGNKKSVSSENGTLDLEAYYLDIENQYLGNEEDHILDLPALEKFIKEVGHRHEPLIQREVGMNGGGGSCICWEAEHRLIWIGFEPCHNVYYYTHLLQKAMSGNRKGKIVCFSHHSVPFNSGTFARRGINLETLKNYFDVVQFSDGELAMINAAIRFLADADEMGEGEAGLKLILKRLDPLWQRLCQPLTRAA